MQIKTQLNDCGSEFSEHVVQKVLAASNPRQNETHCEWMYTQVSSRPFHEIMVYSHKYRYHYHRHHHRWSLCSIDKSNEQKYYSFKKLCFKYLLLNLILLKWLICLLRGCVYNRLVSKLPTIKLHVNDYLRESNNQTEMIETSHEKINKIFILYSGYTSHSMASLLSSNFYTKFNKILLNLFYGHFNINNHQNDWWRQQHQQMCEQQQLPIHKSSLKSFCDLSTNSESIFMITKTYLYTIYGIEHGCGHCVVVTISLSKFLTDQQQRNHSNLLYNNSLILHKVISSHSKWKNHEFIKHYCETIPKAEENCSESHETNSIGQQEQQHQKQQQQHQLKNILTFLLVNNQIKLRITSACYCCQHYLMILHSIINKCHAIIFLIQNDISTKATSNHKLKALRNSYCNTHPKHQHDRNEKFSNCFQHVRRLQRSNTTTALRSSDSVLKNHLNALLFFIIFCIPLLTSSASSVHNLKYSTNIVKTKYGPLRGIILRQNPTIEGYLGVPYGNDHFFTLKSTFLFSH
jgi:hypothetical protein